VVDLHEAHHLEKVYFNVGYCVQKGAEKDRERVSGAWKKVRDGLWGGTKMKHFKSTVAQTTQFNSFGSLSQ